MRVLFVAPYPASRIRLRSYGFITHLAQEHHVELLALCGDTREMADVQALQQHGIAATAIYEPRLLRSIRCLGALCSHTPLQVAFDASSRLRKSIQERLCGGNIDLLHVELLRALGALPKQLPVPVVWDAVDCLSQLYEQGARARSTRILQIIGRRESMRAQKYERRQFSRFSHILVTAERDRRALLASSDQDSNDINQGIAEVSVLPHGVDRQYFQPYTGERIQKRLVFSGKMSFHANIAGVQRLVKQILPLIWQRQPEVTLTIAGSDPPSSVRRLARDPRIEVTGYLPDLRPSIAQAQVAVCPLPYAMGIQSKVIEAMALGTPVVASSHAVAGLQGVAGRDFLVADEAEDFALAVLHLLDNQELWNVLANNGINYIAAHHNWDFIIKQLLDVYARAIMTWKGRGNE